jgi:hypothetical protein
MTFARGLQELGMRVGQIDLMEKKQQAQFAKQGALAAHIESEILPQIEDPQNPMDERAAMASILKKSGALGIDPKVAYGLTGQIVSLAKQMQKRSGGLTFRDMLAGQKFAAQQQKEARDVFLESPAGQRAQAQLDIEPDVRSNLESIKELSASLKARGKTSVEDIVSDLDVMPKLGFAREEVPNIPEIFGINVGVNNIDQVADLFVKQTFSSEAINIFGASRLRDMVKEVLRNPSKDINDVIERFSDIGSLTRAAGQTTQESGFSLSPNTIAKG